MLNEPFSVLLNAAVRGAPKAGFAPEDVWMNSVPACGISSASAPTAACGSGNEWGGVTSACDIL